MENPNKWKRAGVQAFSEMDGGKVSVRRDRCICPVTLPSVQYELQQRRGEKTRGQDREQENSTSFK